MTTLRAAAQQALEALEQRDNATLWHQATHALRDALAQPEPCPNCASLEAQNNELDRKLAEVEREEREACAKVCDDLWKVNAAATECAAAIRARSEK